MFGAPAAPARASYNTNNDAEVGTPPDLDGVTSLNFSPASNHLLATSWNGSAYLWEYIATGATQAKNTTSVGQPLLCSVWRPDGAAVFVGGCDKAVRLWDLATNQTTQVAAHDAPVRHVAYSTHTNMLITAGWDKTIRYWDTRSPNCALTSTLAERVFAMDLQSPCLVVGTAERSLLCFDVTKPQQPLKQLTSQLKWQTRCVSVFPDKSGFLVGSIEGRVAVAHLDDATASQKNFTFKCHRDGSDIYAVNAINFHPVYGTFATAGSDGTYNFWDKDSKQRLKAQNKCMYAPTSPAPITAASFSRDGALYGYALGYDWSRGHAEYNAAAMKSAILLHACKEDEVKAKPKAPAAAGRR